MKVVELLVMNTSSAMAQQIARGLVAAGVTEVVFAPGSRSAPLVYALAPLAEAGLIRTHVRIDERDAGFLALGLARGLRVKAARGSGAEGRFAEAAVAVVTTSGSAVANLHPAVLEAAYGHLPLLAITADRPARLRGTGANQTIDDQSRVLSDVRARFDVGAGGGGSVEDLIAEAVSRSLGWGAGKMRSSGPVQFNVQFDMPLVPTVQELSAWRTEIGAMRDRPGFAGAPEFPEPVSTVDLTITPGTVVVAGDAGGYSANRVIELARAHGLPVLAEPSSPVTASENFVAAHARVLVERADLRESVRTVIVHGKPTLSRPIAALLADPGVSIQRLPDDIDAASTFVTEVVVTEPAVAEAGPVSSDDSTVDVERWLKAWLGAGQEARISSNGALDGSGQIDSSEGLVHAITRRLAASEITLFAASSNTIRYLGAVEELRAEIHASRGLAGIDGLVSTATGLSLALDEQVVLMIGDVALLHDVGGLLTPTEEPAGDLVIVVLNDDGGAIFKGLEHSQDHVVGYLERYFTVPHARNFSDLAAAYGWGYSRVETYSEFLAAFERRGDPDGSNGDPGDEYDSDGSSRNGRRQIIEVALVQDIDA